MNRWLNRRERSDTYLTHVWKLLKSIRRFEKELERLELSTSPWLRVFLSILFLFIFVTCLSRNLLYDIICVCVAFSEQPLQFPYDRE